MAFDLSHNSWKLAFSDGAHYRYCSVEGKNLPALRRSDQQSQTKIWTARRLSSSELL